MLLKTFKADNLHYFWRMANAIKYLFNMKRLPIVLLTVIAASFFAFKTMGTAARNVNPPSKYEEILKLVGEMLKEGHFDPQKMDDGRRGG